MPTIAAAQPAKVAPIVDVAPPKTTTSTDYIVISAEELERPYRVIIQNDDVTPMEFVVLVLLTIFELEFERAMSVMLDAHTKGRALVRTLPLEDAQQRVYSAQSLARDAGYPLSFYLEPDE
ncbi:MAG TPA: ATP-dependent Clp protease adaptor ClpS [Roseiflexaceae bacterium]|jgi:ATP-dependent Clp protease adaptor protein ClpS|nr:ATP-dependent Clp protease adaptor ClpS [Roseiflexaceae bacterium]